MGINRANWIEDYKKGTSANADKLVREYVATPNKIDAATSASAQKNYEDAMRDAKVLARRVTNLKKVSEADLNAAMQAKGQARYSEGTSAGANKAAARVEPYLVELDRIVPTLPAAGRDGVQNVTNRVIPIVKALQDKKAQIG